MHTERLESIMDERYRLENEKKAINKQLAELDREYIVHGAKFEIGDQVKDDLGLVFKVVQHKVKRSLARSKRLLIVYGCQLSYNKESNGEVKFFKDIYFFYDYELTKVESSLKTY